MRLLIIILCFVLTVGVNATSGVKNRKGIKTKISTFDACSQQTGSTSAIEGSCKDYNMCINGQLLHFTCDNGKYFDAEAGYCVKDGEYICYPRPIETTTVSSQYVCSPGAHFIPVPGECYKYQLCINDTPIPLECPEGFVFSEKFKYCVSDTDGSCWGSSSSTSKAPTTETPTPTEEPSTTEAPSSTKEPSTTEAPSSTEEPSTTEAPTSTKEPSTTEAPSSTKEPSTTEAPSSTEEPSTTEAPTSTKEPSTTEAPSSTEEPSTTEALSSTEEPSTTEAPSSTEETSTTEAPSSTEEPSTTEAPSSTNGPSTTETPTPTEEPSTTETPTSTEEPSTTEMPTSTKEPPTTEAPSSTEEPSTTEVPPSTKEPSTTETPTSTEESSTTESPSSTKEPSTTEAPPSTEEPSTTETPTSTEEPSTTEAPASSEEPSTTEAPASSEEPSTTETPIPTEEPSTTETPTSTEEPSTTDAPSSTEEPSTTKVPTSTEEPSTTEAPASSEEPSTTETPPNSTTEVSANETESTETPSSTEEPSSTAQPTTTTDVPTTTTPNPTTKDTNLCEGVVIGVVPHEDCNKFYMCINGVGTVQVCPAGNYFNPTTNRCATDTTGVCVGRCASAPTGTRYVDENDCQWYYECRNGLEFSVSCQSGFYFDGVTLDCVENAENLCGSTSPNSCENKADGTIIPHGDCGSYYVCISNETQVQSCNDGYRFNIQQSKCVEDPTYTCICELNSEAIFASEECNEYYVCTNGKAAIQNCPEGEYFHATEMRCSTDQKAACGSD